MRTGEQSPSSEPGAWPSYLRGDDEHEIASRLSEIDPLRLRERSARRLRERWILIEPDRAFRRAVTACAYGARREPPPADLEDWALAKVDLAIDQIVRTDREAQLAHPEILSDDEKDFALLTSCLAVHPERVREITVKFNGLDELARRAFFELCIEGRQVPEVVESGPWDEDMLYEAIQAALAPFGLDAPSDDEDDPDGGQD
jgi:hypothetical protein